MGKYGYDIKLIIFFLISILLISGCTNRKEYIKIGVVGTMSGANSDLAVSGRRGVEIAIGERNDVGGIKGKIIEIVVKDDKNDKETALKVDRELVEKNVQYVIGHYTSAMQLAVMEYVRQQNVLFLSPTVSSDSLSQQDDNFIRFMPISKEQGSVLAKAIEINGNKKIAVFSDFSNREYALSMRGTFIDKVRSNGKEIVLKYEFDNENPEFYTKLVDLLSETDADSVLMIANAYSSVTLALEIQKRGLDIEMYMPLWANTNSLLEMGGNSIEGINIVGTIDIENTSERYREFEKKFRNIYGEKPTFASVYSYEAANILFDALEKIKEPTPEKVKRTFLENGVYKGLQDVFEIDEYGDNTREYKMFKVENGEMILFEK